MMSITSCSNIIKTVLSLVGGVSQFLAFKFGLEFAERLGLPFQLFLTCNSGSLMCSSIMVLSNSVSKCCCINDTVKPSLFEIVFNIICCVFFIVCSAVLMKSETYAELYFTYQTVPLFYNYPALTTLYILGFVAGALHLMDAILVLMARSRQQR